LGGEKNINTHNSSEVFSAEESLYVGTEVLNDVTNLLAELVCCSEVSFWLQQTVSQLINQYISNLSSLSSVDQGNNKVKSSAAVDLCFVVGLLPIVRIVNIDLHLILFFISTVNH
jgi:hypothetical protein